MADPESKNVFLGGAYFRCGTAISRFLDNMSMGGIGIKINLDTGELGKGTQTSPIKYGKLNWLSTHPDTGFIFEGFKIPKWDFLKDEILKLSQRLSFIPYIGWDVVPMDDDFLIIEANSHSDIRGLQIHDPLLNSPQVKSFFKHYGIQ